MSDVITKLRKVLGRRGPKACRCGRLVERSEHWYPYCSKRCHDETMDETAW